VALLTNLDKPILRHLLLFLCHLHDELLQISHYQNINLLSVASERMTARTRRSGVACWGKILGRAPHFVHAAGE
jgi:hypothetical protein